MLDPLGDDGNEQMDDCKISCSLFSKSYWQMQYLNPLRCVISSQDVCGRTR